MKLNSVLAQNLNSMSFRGFQHVKSNIGANEYDFNYPYDDSKYDAYLEILSAENDTNHDFHPKSVLDSVKLNPNGVKVNLERAYGLPHNAPFAYRYKLVDKTNSQQQKYLVESGQVIHADNNAYNLVTQNGSPIAKGGSIYHIFPDSFNVGYKYDADGKIVFDKQYRDEALKSGRTFSNIFGGTLAGIEEKLPEIRKFGYKKILLTPFTEGSGSHHYWTKNAMQICPALGSINDFASLIRGAFKNGNNLISDAAIGNEGIEGIHFLDVLQRGENSPYYYWFRADNLKDNPILLPTFSKNHKFISHKVVNSPHKYVEDEKTGQVQIIKNGNTNYNPNKRTYIQVFDNTLVSEQRNDTTQLIEAYDKLASAHPTDINTHDDTVYHYKTPIDPQVYNDNIQRINEHNKHVAKEERIKLSSYEGTRLACKDVNYEYEGKFEGGYVAWDANGDIPKLNYVMSKQDIKTIMNAPAEQQEKLYADILRANYQVQDYAVSSGRYWAKKVNNILLEYVSNELKGLGNDAHVAYSKIMKLVDEGKLPNELRQNISPEIISNIFNRIHKIPGVDKSLGHSELLLSGLMDLPLDSVEFGDDIVATLGYPHITNRASRESEVGMTRYELNKQSNPHVLPEYADVYKQVTKMFSEDLTKFAKEVIEKADAKLPEESKLLKEGNIEMSRQMLPVIAQDIAKFAVILALVPAAAYKMRKGGEIAYAYNDLKKLTLKDLGIHDINPAHNAAALVAKMRQGIDRIPEKVKNDLAESIFQRQNGMNEKSVNLAKVIIDRLQAGLDFRTDATKDIADMDAIRNFHGTFSEELQKVIEFWKKFNSAVHKENRNSYTIAEYTDIWDLFMMSGKTGHFKDGTDAERKLTSIPGFTTSSNYSYAFPLSGIFGKDFTNGATEKRVEELLYNKLVGGDDFLHSGQLDSIRFSHTFIGNHDKPRPLHCFALDMELFHTNFADENNAAHRKIAAAILKSKSPEQVSEADISSINFENVSNKAIAMADTLKGSLRSIISERMENSRGNVIFEAFSKSIADLAKGKYLDSVFQADAFGVKPFETTIDMILEQSESKYGLKLSPSERNMLINKTLEKMLKPAMEKFEGQLSYLVSFPGNPTLYAGDELGMTGYEEKTKNVWLQNRNPLNWESVNDTNKTFINDFYERVHSLIALRSKPELEPLNTGTPYALAKQDSKDGAKITALLRHNTDGRMVLSLFNHKGFSMDNTLAKGDSRLTLDKISLHSGGERDGLPVGLKPGTIFSNINPNDAAVYKVCPDGNSYCIRKVDGTINLDDNTMTGSTMILYADPAKQVSFEGAKILNNKQYNFVTNPYAKVSDSKVGVRLKSMV